MRTALEALRLSGLCARDKTLQRVIAGDGKEYRRRIAGIDSLN
tara:strand:- start:32577 stop:32705 length:129 start_codon:yes stop_codon:yes gene_type:complete